MEIEICARASSTAGGMLVGLKVCLKKDRKEISRYMCATREDPLDRW